MPRAAKRFRLCDTSFGNCARGDQSDHLIHHIPQTITFISAKRPIVSTIKVAYQDQFIPGGPPGSCGYWMYYASSNAIIFSDLSFAEGDIDNGNTLHVTFTEDVGQNGQLISILEIVISRFRSAPASQ